MVSITLKSLPSSLHRTLKSQAKLHKRSLNQEIIALLEETVAPSHQVDIEAMLAREEEFRKTLNFTTTAKKIRTAIRSGRL